MASVDIDTHIEWVPELWSAFIVDALTKNVVLVNLTDRRWEALFEGGGNRVHIPQAATISATKNAITDVRNPALDDWADTISFANPNPTESTLDLDTRAYAAVKVFEPVELLGKYAVVQHYSEELGRALAEQIDTDIGATLDSTTNNKGTDNVPITDQIIRESREVLDNNNVKHDDRFLVVSPGTLMDMFAIERYANSLYAASTGNFSQDKGRGFVGRIYEFDVYETTNLPSGASGKKNFMFQREAVAFAMPHGVVFDTKEPHDQFAVALRARVYYGDLLLRSGAVVEIAAR